jgi:transposase
MRSNSCRVMRSKLRLPPKDSASSLNGRNPQHYLADVLAHIADHPAQQIADPLPWNWTPADLQRAAA